jgi:hypothetical protein
MSMVASGMSKRADVAFARFSQQVTERMADPTAELLAVLSVEDPGLILPDGTFHPRFVEAMVRTLTGGLRAALSAPRSGPVN